MFSNSIKLENTNENHSDQQGVPQIPVESSTQSLELDSKMSHGSVSQLHQHYKEKLQHAQFQMALNKTLGMKNSQPPFQDNQANLFYAALNSNCFEEAAYIYLQEFGLYKNKFAEVILHSVKTDFNDTVFKNLDKHIKMAKLEYMGSYSPPDSESQDYPLSDLPENTSEPSFLIEGVENEELLSQPIKFLEEFNLKQEQRLKEKLDKKISEKLFRTNQADRFYALLKNNCEDAAKIFLKEFSLYENKFADVILQDVKKNYGDKLFDTLFATIENNISETLSACVMDSVLNSYAIWDPFVVNPSVFEHYSLPFANFWLEGYKPEFAAFRSSRKVSSAWSISPYPAPLDPEEVLGVIKKQLIDYSYQAVLQITMRLDKRQSVPALYKQVFGNAYENTLIKDCINRPLEELTINEFIQSVSVGVIMRTIRNLQEILCNFSQENFDSDNLLFIANLAEKDHFYLADFLLSHDNALPNTIDLLRAWFIDSPSKVIKDWISGHVWLEGPAQPGNLKILDRVTANPELLFNGAPLLAQINPQQISQRINPAPGMHELSQPAMTESSSSPALHTVGLFSVMENDIKKMLHMELSCFNKAEQKAFIKDLEQLQFGEVSKKQILQILNDYIQKKDMPLEEIAVRLFIPKDQISYYSHVVKYLLFKTIINGDYEKAAEIAYAKINRDKATEPLIKLIYGKFGKECIDKLVDAHFERLENLNENKLNQQSTLALR